MSQARTQPSIPRQIRLEGEHYLLRTLTPEDASDEACTWLADPAL